MATQSYLLYLLRHPDPHPSCANSKPEANHLHYCVDPDEAPVGHDAGDDAAEGEDEQPGYGHCYGVGDADLAVVGGDVVVGVVAVDCVCCAGEGGGGDLAGCEVLRVLGGCDGY